MSFRRTFFSARRYLAEAASRLGDRRLPVLSRRLVGVAEREPETAARLIRAWLVEDRPKGAMTRGAEPTR